MDSVAGVAGLLAMATATPGPIIPTTSPAEGRYTDALDKKYGNNESTGLMELDENIGGIDENVGGIGGGSIGPVLRLGGLADVEEQDVQVSGAALREYDAPSSKTKVLAESSSSSSSDSDGRKRRRKKSKKERDKAQQRQAP